MSGTLLWNKKPDKIPACIGGKKENKASLVNQSIIVCDLNRKLVEITVDQITLQSPQQPLRFRAIHQLLNISEPYSISFSFYRHRPIHAWVHWLINTFSSHALRSSKDMHCCSLYVVSVDLLFINVAFLFKLRLLYCFNHLNRGRKSNISLKNRPPKIGSPHRRLVRLML